MFKFFVGFIVVILLMAGYFSGIIPYYILFPLQPSYWEIKKLCKLNKLPNNEEKYNKMLAYYDMGLDDIDWKKINKDKHFLCKKNYRDDYEYNECLPNVREYMAELIEKQMNHRLYTSVWIYSDKSNLNRDNITDMEITGAWETRFFVLDGNEGSGFYWSERSLYCSDFSNKGK